MSHPVARSEVGSESAPLIVAVVLTWNDTKMTSRCLDSLRQSSYPNLGIVVVDNGSEVPGCAILKERYPEIETVQLDKNYGFTGGCNRGIERALEMGSEYVFLLNNDTIVDADAVDELLRAMRERPDVAIASAILLFIDPPKRVRFYVAQLDMNKAFHHQPGKGSLYGEEFKKVFETDFVPACAVLLRSTALRKVGLFDESLFTNWEDYDICCRFIKAGWNLITVGTAEVVHAHGQTTGRISPFITYLSTRNRLICLFRYGTPLGILKNSLFYLRSVFWQVREYGFTNWPCNRALLRGMLHFLLGVRGNAGPQNRSDRKAS
jgi:GT2 family glycosyltransferase